MGSPFRGALCCALFWAILVVTGSGQCMRLVAGFLVPSQVGVGGIRSSIITSSTTTCSFSQARLLSKKLVMQQSDDMLLPRAQDALMKRAQFLRRVGPTRGMTLRHSQNEQRKRLLPTPDNTEDESTRKIDRQRLKDIVGKDNQHAGNTTINACPSLFLLHRSNGIDLPYETTVRALRAYHNQNGNLVMPRRFIVPEDVTYPKLWWGVDLASSVYNMKWWLGHIRGRPERVSELNELGFIWARLQPEWNIVLEALVYYHSIHGDVLVGNKFVVPHGHDLWPKATWGVPLGNYVRSIRSRHDFLHGPNSLSRRQQLESLGFVWDVHEQRFLEFYSVLTHFARLHGCGVFSASGQPKPLRIPSTFVVPNEKEVWPEEYWGFPLGPKCTAVRQKQLYVKNKPNRQQMLEELGFRWNGNADLAWLKVVHAAAIYSKLHNRTLNVPNNFIVPKAPRDLWGGDDWPWPKHLWGLPLGQRLKEIRVNGTYLKGLDGPKRRRQLDALGFVWNTSEHRFQVFYGALKHYAQLHKSGVFSDKGKPKEIVVPSTFTVPSGDSSWPNQLWEFDLGRKCAGVRAQMLYVKNNPQRLRMLEEIGFRPG